MHESLLTAKLSRNAALCTWLMFVLLDHAILPSYHTYLLIFLTTLIAANGEIFHEYDSTRCSYTTQLTSIGFINCFMYVCKMQEIFFYLFF